MKNIVFTLCMFLMAGSLVHADAPATEFYVVRTQDIGQATAKGGTELGPVTKNAVCEGYFQGNSCCAQINVENKNINIKAVIYTNPKDGKQYINYSFSIYDQKEKKEIFSATGNTLYRRELSLEIDKDQKDKEYTILFAWTNLGC